MPAAPGNATTIAARAMVRPKECNNDFDLSFIDSLLSIKPAIGGGYYQGLKGTVAITLTI